MIKKHHLRRDEKVLQLKGWFTRHQICRQDLLAKQPCRTQKIRPFFYFVHPFRQWNATCKLAAIEDYRVFIKIIFRGCPIIHSLSNGVVGELSINLIKLRWWATGLFRLGRICFSGLIYCDIRLLTRCKICFTLGLSNYFSLKPLSLCLKVI